MKKLFVILGLFLSASLYAQKKDINFIIMVDDNVNPAILAPIYLCVIDSNGKEEKIEVQYCPGNLSVNEVDYKKLITQKIEKLFLEFKYSVLTKKKQFINNYRINVYKSWIDYPYFILKIYNTTKKQYKYRAIPSKDYVVDYDSPSGQTFEIGLHK